MTTYNTIKRYDTIDLTRADLVPKKERSALMNTIFLRFMRIFPRKIIINKKTGDLAILEDDPEERSTDFYDVISLESFIESLLQDQEIDLAYQDNDKTNALLFLFGGTKDLVKEERERRADLFDSLLEKEYYKENLKKALNMQNKDGYTPLFFAILQGYSLDVIKKIIQAGAQVGIATSERRGRQIPLHVASEKGIFDLVAILLKKADVKATINAMDSNQNTPIMLALDKGYDLLASFLIGQGADPWLQDRYGRTALHLSAGKNLASSTKAILKLDNTTKENVNLKDTGGNTALHYAVMTGDETLVSLLLGKGADPRIENSDKKTAMNLAASLSLMSIASILIDKAYDLGGSSAATDQKKITPTPTSQLSATLELLKEKFINLVKALKG